MTELARSTSPAMARHHGQDQHYQNEYTRAVPQPVTAADAIVVLNADVLAMLYLGAEL